MDVSIVVPFYNEQECAESVLREILSRCPGAEIIAVDDGSSDRTAEVLEGIEGVRCIRHGVNLGQSAALFTGLLAATRSVCVMLDGDGQNDPADIPHLIEVLASCDAVCGYRANRQDTWQRRMASRIANGIRRFVLRDGLRDTGCSLKAIKRENVKYLVPFNGLHRFLGAFLSNAGLEIREIPVNHRPRHSGKSKYTIGGRALRGLYDLLGVQWYLKRHIQWQRSPYTKTKS
jgi:dolichol-phosphate mannosyltransferase